MPKQRKSKEEESMQMDCVRKTELSYHDVAPVQDSIEKEYYQDVSSESGVTLMAFSRPGWNQGIRNRSGDTASHRSRMALEFLP